MKKNPIIFVLLISMLFMECCSIKSPIENESSFHSQSISSSITSSSSFISSSSSFEELQCTFFNCFSEGWTYIPNEQSSSPQYYSSGSLKLNTENTGILSPTFPFFTGRLRVIIQIDQLLKNIKIEPSNEHVFIVSMLNDQEQVIVERYVDTVLSEGSIHLLIEGERASKIAIVMSGFPYIDGACYNVSISSITIKKA